MTHAEPGDGDAAVDGVSRRDVLAVTAAAGAGVAVLSAGGCANKNNGDGQMLTNAPPTAVPVTLHVNGRPETLMLEPRVSLLDALRNYAGHTGTKKGCDHGQCGACTVLVDGRRVYSCLTLAITTQGRKITTIEGIAGGEQLHPLQAAFVQHDAFQCGYCTPGQICSAVGLLNEKHATTDDDIREQMAGNLCRCGAYPNIVTAIRQAMTRTA